MLLAQDDTEHDYDYAGASNGCNQRQTAPSFSSSINLGLHHCQPGIADVVNLV